MHIRNHIDVQNFLRNHKWEITSVGRRDMNYTVRATKGDMRIQWTWASYGQTIFMSMPEPGSPNITLEHTRQVTTRSYEDKAKPVVIYREMLAKFQ